MKATTSDNHAPAPAKCLSGILRSLLCAGSLPTHPSDQFNNIETNTTQIDRRNPGNSLDSEADNEIKQADASSKPGVVAKLMGLDSLPASPLPIRSQKTLGSYFRSRSVNSIDFLSQFDPVQQAFHRRHRRVRTSVSFREVPSLFSLDDKSSVVFPLEEVDETAVCERKIGVIYEKGKMEKRARGKCRNGGRFEERTVNKNLPGRKMESGEARRSLCATKKKDFNERKSTDLKEFRRAVMNKPEKQVKKKKMHGVRKIHPEPAGRGEASPEICSNKQYSTSQKRTGSLTKNGDAIPKSRAANATRNECINMLEEVFRLTRESVDEIDREWTDGPILKFEDFEDVCVQFGRQILGELLIEIVDEFMVQGLVSYSS